jgi:CspA family cold shock protein
MHVNGKMLWFNEEKGYGFIEAESGERVYVHRSAFVAGHAPVGRCKGLAVTFAVAPGEEGQVAVDVSQPPELDQRRATRHHNGSRIL